MVVGFCFVPFMNMVMCAMLSVVVMLVDAFPLNMIMRVLVLMGVLMAMDVSVLVAMLAYSGMFMLVFVFVSVLMGMVMVVFMIAFHSVLLFFNFINIFPLIA